ncbi:MAG: hypothetical protein MI892_18160, partial [Desulfobacterales bacterium]|nr:hypothetical protein [Desulfobacterales bacterium]
MGNISLFRLFAVLIWRAGMRPIFLCGTGKVYLVQQSPYMPFGFSQVRNSTLAGKPLPLFFKSGR